MDRNDPKYRRIVKDLREDPRSRFCFLTGEAIPPGGGDPAHILPVSIFPEMATNKYNIVIVSRRAHNIIDQGTMEQIARLPKIHAWLGRMRILDQAYYSSFTDKLSPWLNTWEV